MISILHFSGTLAKKYSIFQADAAFFSYLPGISDDNKVENSCQIISQNLPEKPK